MKNPSMFYRSGKPLVRTAAALVFLIAVTAAGSLWGLLVMYNRSVRATAAMTVLNTGRLIAAHLAEHPMVSSDGVPGDDWSGFAETARSLRKIENGLQFVSVSRDGATVFHEQLSALPEPEPGVFPEDTLREDLDLILGRQLIMLGAESVPVMTFTVRPSSEGSGFDSIQVGLRKDAVDREGFFPLLAVRSMFRVALSTVLVSFGVCLAVIVLMMRREIVVEAHRRRQEHLAFAGMMANGIVHDFRNPMSSLKLDAQMLKKESAKGDSSDHARLTELSSRITMTLDRMDKVFQEFLYLSKPSSRSGEECDLLEVVKDCAEFMKPRLERSGIRLDMTLCDPPLPVKCFSTSLGRAMINIVTNAEYFSPEKGAVVIKCHRMKNQAVVDIEDEGPGVEDADKPKVFEMFFSKRPAGTGMGLFLAKTAVEECGGRIQVLDGAGGRGACFRIMLPLIS